MKPRIDVGSARVVVHQQVVVQCCVEFLDRVTRLDHDNSERLFALVLAHELDLSGQLLRYGGVSGRFDLAMGVAGAAQYAHGFRPFGQQRSARSPNQGRLSGSPVTLSQIMRTAG